tara:strand:+ start:127 stop:1809 length:1683 start_codon:yes stop_codon:yes gene_type:complete
MIRKYNGIVTLIKGVKKRAFVSLLLSLFLGLSEGVSLLLIIPLLSISGVHEAHEAKTGIVAKISQTFDRFGLELSLITVLFIYIIILSTYALIKFYQSMNTIKISQKVIVDWRIKFFNILSKANWRQFKANKLSDYQNVLTLEIKKFGSIVNLLVNLVGNSILILIYLIISSFLSVELTLIALIPILVIGLLNISVNRNTYKIGQKTVNFNQSIQLNIIEFLSAIKLVKAYQNEASHLKRFSQLNHEVEEKVVNFQYETQKTKLFFEVMAAIFVVIYIYLALSVFKSDFAEILLLIFIFVRLVPKVVKLVGNYQHILNQLPAVERTQELMSSFLVEPIEFDKENNVSLNFNEYLAFKNVDFTYESKQVLHQTSFKIPVNSITLLKGESGVGKSTIIDLLLGFYEVNSGEILLDGQPFSSINKSAWQNIIAYVPQEPFLFHDTIRANILWGNPEATKKDVLEVLELIEALTFIKRMPKGIDTVVGDRGEQLSGGERQRVILARALIKKPKVLILDEATNQLDEENVVLISKLLERLKLRMTIVFATHQDRFDKIADNIIQL